MRAPTGRCARCAFLKLLARLAPQAPLFIIGRKAPCLRRRAIAAGFAPERVHLSVATASREQILQRAGRAAVEDDTVVWGSAISRAGRADLSALAATRQRAMLTLTLIIGVLVSLVLVGADRHHGGRDHCAGLYRAAARSTQGAARRLVAVVGTHVIVSLLAPWLFLYGTRRLTVSILVGLVLATGIGYLRGEFVSEC